MLTPDFSNYTCFLITMVWAFVEHMIMFTAISFTWSNPQFLKQLNFWEPFIPTLISIFSFHFFPSFFMTSFKGVFKKRILHQQEAYAIPNTPSVWPLHVTPVPLVSCDHLKWWFGLPCAQPSIPTVLHPWTQPTENGKYWGGRLPESSKVQSRNLSHAGNIFT